MKKLVLLAGVIAAGLMGLNLTPARAYVIDGSVLDWGIDLSSANSKGYLDSHLPSGGLDTDTVTEDNADKYHKWTEVGPGWAYYNYFDAEAIYFDNDQSYAYIAIVQGLPISGYKVNGYPRFYPGDIGLDLNHDGVYEYGLDVREYDAADKKAKLFNNLTASNWQDVYYPAFSIANPWEIKSGSTFNWVDFVYSENQNSHYVLEAAIPLSYLGLSADPGAAISPLTVHWTMQCGNDYLNLPADVNPVPEPGSLVLLVTGLFGLAGFLAKTGLPAGRQV